MKRQKIVLTPSLKAEDYDVGSVPIAMGTIKSVDAVKTKFDDENTTSTLIHINDNATNTDKPVFANSSSINNLIEAFGEEDNIWVNKSVRVVCNKENYLKKKQLVIEAIK